MIEITKDPLDLHSLTQSLADQEVGALVTFSGIVREMEGDEKLTHIDYEIYDDMALKSLGEIESQMHEKWDLKSVALVHRKGKVAVGEASVLIAVQSAHRKEAFAAAGWAMDEIKRQTPIWKNL